MDKGIANCKKEERQKSTANCKKEERQKSTYIYKNNKHRNKNGFTPMLTQMIPNRCEDITQLPAQVMTNCTCGLTDDWS